MQNVEMTVKGQKLTVEIDLSKRLGPSKSGKTTVIATTNGNVEVPQHSDVKIGVNCYAK